MLNLLFNVFDKRIVVTYKADEPVPFLQINLVSESGAPVGFGNEDSELHVNSNLVLVAGRTGVVVFPHDLNGVLNYIPPSESYSTLMTLRSDAPSGLEYLDIRVGEIIAMTAFVPGVGGSQVSVYYGIIRKEKHRIKSAMNFHKDNNNGVYEGAVNLLKRRNK